MSNMAHNKRRFKVGENAMVMIIYLNIYHSTLNSYWYVSVSNGCKEMKEEQSYHRDDKECFLTICIFLPEQQGFKLKYVKPVEWITFLENDSEIWCLIFCFSSRGAGSGFTLTDLNSGEN